MLYLLGVNDLLHFAIIKDVLSLDRINLLNFVGIEDLSGLTFPESRFS